MNMQEKFKQLSERLSDKYHVIGVHELEKYEITTTYMDIQSTYGDHSSILSIRADEFMGSNGVGKLAFTLSFPYSRGNLLRVLVPPTEAGAGGFMQALRVVLDEITEETFILDESYPVNTAWCVARLCVKNLVGGVYVISPDLISSRWFSSTVEVFTLEDVELGSVRLIVDWSAYKLSISDGSELVKSFNIKETTVHEMQHFILDYIEKSKKDNAETVGEGDGNRTEHGSAVDADDTSGGTASSASNIEEGKTPLLPVADWNTISDEEVQMLYVNNNPEIAWHEDNLFDIADVTTSMHHLETRFMESVAVTKAGDQKVVLRACSHRRAKNDVTPAMQIDILPTEEREVSLWVSIGDDEKLGKTIPSRRNRALAEEEKSTFNVIHIEMSRYSMAVEIKDVLLKIMQVFDESLRFIDGGCLRKTAHLMAKSIRWHMEEIQWKTGFTKTNVTNIDDAMELVEYEVSSMIHASMRVMHDLILRKDRCTLFSLHTRSQLGTISIKEDAHLGVCLETLLNDRSLCSHVYPTPDKITDAVRELGDKMLH
jgi:hypothetical protein